MFVLSFRHDPRNIGHSEIGMENSSTMSNIWSRISPVPKKIKSSKYNNNTLPQLLESITKFSDMEQAVVCNQVSRARYIYLVDYLELENQQLKEFLS